jgi:hypothetical protein
VGEGIETAFYSHMESSAAKILYPYTKEPATTLQTSSINVQYVYVAATLETKKSAKETDNKGAKFEEVRILLNTDSQNITKKIR